MSPVSPLPTLLERPAPAPMQAPLGNVAQQAAIANPFSGTQFGTTSSQDSFSATPATDHGSSLGSSAVRVGAFGAFANFMDNTLVRYVGYFNEIAASIGHSFFPEKHLNADKWMTKGYPTWFKALNGATWLYAGLDVYAKAAEAYKTAKADPNSEHSPTSMALRTALDRGLFQAAATIFIPVKIIGKLDSMIGSALKGKLSPNMLRNAKFLGTMLPIPLIAAFVDGGTNMFLDMAVRPWLGTPKHIIDTHGKPHPAAQASHDSPSASAPVAPLSVERLPEFTPQQVTPPPVANAHASPAHVPVAQHLFNPFATVGTNFLSDDTPVSSHTLRANVKFNQFAFE